MLTFRELFEKANPYQRERLLDLVTALRQLRREVAEDHNVLDPVHHSPQSALVHCVGELE